jgi:hypothetical protein
MSVTKPLSFCFVILAASACALNGQPVPGDTQTSIESPSPDGKFAFRISYGEDLRTIDLIDAKSEKVVFHVADTDESQTYWHVLWAPDSKRFALMTRLGHPIQGVSVYAKSDDRFHEIKLPELPEAKIPERLKHGKKFPHVAGLDWQEAKEWNPDGSLVVNIDTMIDGGDDGSLSATRTVVLGFDKSGKARIVKSTIKYAAEKD